MMTTMRVGLNREMEALREALKDHNNKDWEVTKELGKGAYGVVYKVRVLCL